MRVIDTFVTLLPPALRPYGKAIAALILGAGVVAASAAGAPSWVPIVIAVLNAPVVYAVENVEAPVEEPLEEEYVPEHAA